MKKQEILMSLVLAHQEKRWDRIESILKAEGLEVANNNIKIEQHIEKPVLKNIQSFEIKNRTQQFEFKKQNTNQFVNNFVDDLTIETSEIATDKKITANVKPKMRRPPANESESVAVICRNCSKPMNISSFEANLRSGADASFTCGSCLKNLRGMR